MLTLSNFFDNSFNINNLASLRTILKYPFNLKYPTNDH